jgi:ABC-type oligopeptide transport system ATPase subunit
MYLGRLCEVGPTEQLFAQPAQPYTALLLEAIPVPDPSVKPIANVPVGDGSDQYKENSPAAPDKTLKTGNAGNRVACGVIKRI